jgi:hypothetical protein
VSVAIQPCSSLNLPIRPESTLTPRELPLGQAYIACFGLGVGPVPSLLVSEITSSKMRGKGSSLAMVRLPLSRSFGGLVAAGSELGLQY